MEGCLHSRLFAAGWIDLNISLGKPNSQGYTLCVCWGGGTCIGLGLHYSSVGFLGHPCGWLLFMCVLRNPIKCEMNWFPSYDAALRRRISLPQQQQLSQMALYGHCCAVLSMGGWVWGWNRYHYGPLRSASQTGVRRICKSRCQFVH